jgi:hypothetical protein
MGETPDRWNRKGIRIEGKGLTRVTRREWRGVEIFQLSIQDKDP